MKRIFKIGKKNIGEYDSVLKTFTKEVLKSKHLFRVLDAWGIDGKTVKSLPSDTSIIITELEENKIYKCQAKHYQEQGQYYHFKDEKADHKVQLFLPRKMFQVETPKPLTEEEKAKSDYYSML